MCHSNLYNFILYFYIVVMCPKLGHITSPAGHTRHSGRTWKKGIRGRSPNKWDFDVKIPYLLVHQHLRCWWGTVSSSLDIGLVSGL